MVKVNNLTKVYKSKNKNNCVALNDISFELPDKGLIFVVGKSGSGKSTLLNLLGGLDKETSGDIFVNGNEISKYSENKLYSYRTSMVGFIFQDFHLLDQLTVEENISLSLKLQNEYSKEEIDKVLKDVDLEGYNNRYPNELSGGQKQRVAIARALVKQPNVILADEPTGNLDSNTTEQIIKLIKNISEERLVIVVSHNLFDAYEYADRIVELSQGEIINDLILNKDYSNDIKINDNKVILPLLKRFSDEELDQILVECKKENIKYLRQDNNKFIDYIPVATKDNYIDIKKSNLSVKEAFKFSFIFGKTKIFKLFFSALLAAMIIVVLALSQSVASFDSADLIKEELENSESVYCIRKNVDANIGESHLKNISDLDLELFEEKGVDIYRLYNDSYHISGTVASSILSMPLYSVKNIFVGESNGVLVTNKEYVKKLLSVDELEILEASEYKPYGIYITDYFADCLRYYQIAGSYASILSNSNNPIRYRAHINGIIKTNYQDKYSDVIDRFSEITNMNAIDEEMMNFYDYVVQALAIGYSFDDNYIKSSREDISVRNYQYTYKTMVNGKDVSDTIKYFSASGPYDIDLADNEIYMDFDNYNVIFGTKYNLSNLDTFTPHEITFKCGDYEDEVEYEETFTIVKIGPRISGPMLVSDNKYKEMKTALTFCYGLYFDGDDLTSIIDKSIQNNYVNMSIKMTAVQTMSEAVSVFNAFFELIVLILLTLCVFILISFGLKNVKSTMYEIGVLKALGCRFSNFIIIFGLHTLVIVVLTSFMSFMGFRIFADLSNDILVESVKQLAPSHFLINLSFIKFNLKIILTDIILVILISMPKVPLIPMKV